MITRIQYVFCVVLCCVVDRMYVLRTGCTTNQPTNQPHEGGYMRIHLRMYISTLLVDSRRPWDCSPYSTAWLAPGTVRSLSPDIPFDEKYHRVYFGTHTFAHVTADRRYSISHRDRLALSAEREEREVPRSRLCRCP